MPARPPEPDSYAGPVILGVVISVVVCLAAGVNAISERMAPPPAPPASASPPDTSPAARAQAEAMKAARDAKEFDEAEHTVINQRIARCMGPDAISLPTREFLALQDKCDGTAQAKAFSAAYRDTLREAKAAEDAASRRHGSLLDPLWQ